MALTNEQIVDAVVKGVTEANAAMMDSTEKLNDLRVKSSRNVKTDILVLLNQIIIFLLLIKLTLQ